MMNLNILDFVLLNITSYLLGIATGLSICCKHKDTFMQRSRSVEHMSQLNHQNTIYPPQAPVIQASAPPVEKVLNIKI